MLSVQDQDLNYQPASNPYSYSSPKVSIFKKIFNLFKKLFRLNYFLFLGCAFLTLSLIIININYFNIISFSYLYPVAFSSLPHRYDTYANKSALSGIPYSKEIEGYTLEGTLYKVKQDSLLINYKGKIVEFLLSPDLNCSTQVTKKITQTIEETYSEAAFCSDVLSQANYGKNVSIFFMRDSKSYNIINSISLLTRKTI